MPILKSQEEFINDVIAVHGDKYDYSLVRYINTRTKIKIICKEHGIFEQTPHCHLTGRGCRECYNIRAGQSVKKSTIQFIIDAIKIHKNLYDYSLVKYKNNRINIKIICKEHGIFNQLPMSHLAGHICRKCADVNNGNNNRRSTAQFISNAIKIHKNLYDYSSVNYKGNNIKVKIICKKHGVFKQKPRGHLSGAGCHACSITISKKERQWLSFVGIPDDKDHRQISLYMHNKSRILADGYDPTSNTVYEFHGDYWHGNPEIFLPDDINKNNKKSFGELYEATMRKESLIKESGYNLITMWENDWKKKSPY